MHNTRVELLLTLNDSGATQKLCHTHRTLIGKLQSDPRCAKKKP